MGKQLYIVDPVTTGSCDNLPIGTVFTKDETDGVVAASDGSFLGGKMTIVCPVLATPFEKSQDFQPLIDDWDPKSLKFQLAGDGTLVRLFFHAGTWRKVTNFSLDLTAVNPALSQTKSFEDMFAEAAEASKLDYDLLASDRVYFFLLEHPENIIIVQHNKPNLIFVGSVKPSQVAPFYDVESLDLECKALLGPGGLGPQVLSFDDVMSKADTRNALFSNLPSVGLPDLGSGQESRGPPELRGPVTFVGLMATKFDKDGFSRFRLDSFEYKTAKEMRGKGAASDRRFKLLSILCGSTKICSDDEKKRKLKHFLLVLPNYLSLVKQLDTELDELYQVVHTFYIMFFKDNNHQLVTQSFVRFLHKIQKELFLPVVKPRKMRMTKEHVGTFILEQDAKQVSHLLNCLRDLKKRCTAEEFDTIITYLKK